MARAVTDDLKQSLKASGLWDTFCQRRDELKQQGFAPVDARTQALSECEALMASKDFSPGAASIPSAVSLPVSLAAGDSSPEFTPISEFGGRTETDAAVIRWVARHMFLDVEPADCPDPMAWNYLKHLRSCPAAVQDFWRTVYPKLLPSKTQMESSVPLAFDGVVQVELIQAIQKMRQGEAA